MLRPAASGADSPGLSRLGTPPGPPREQKANLRVLVYSILRSMYFLGLSYFQGLIIFSHPFTPLSVLFCFPSLISTCFLPSSSYLHLFPLPVLPSSTFLPHQLSLPPPTLSSYTSTLPSPSPILLLPSPIPLRDAARSVLKRGNAGARRTRYPVGIRGTEFVDTRPGTFYSPKVASLTFKTGCVDVG